ncbi:MAG: HAMP domain-containing histidine kinase [Lachnospiraceae bacterium]|nr:HAMP domain-containing histidine kinase [Lachnospiraceae bacterium]
MKKGKSTAIFKRLGLGLAQHFVAAAVCVLIAVILFNSFLTVTTMKGQKTYSLDPLTQKSSFEESELFQDLFQTAINDVIRLGVIQDQMEVNGHFEASKVIDVTAFMNRYGATGVYYGISTARFKLEDLIIWDRYGLEYKSRTMSLSEFVNYYKNACVPENFLLDGYGNLTFAGYFNESIHDENYYEKQAPIIEKMREFTTEQLEDMAFSYILGKVSEGITLNKEDDGGLTVYIDSLVCRYATIDHQTQLYDLVDNWPDFMRLQKNVAEVCTTLAENYELYQNCAKLYAEGRSNLKYVIRISNDQGEKTSYTNISDLADLDDESLTERFEENLRYLIYYPNSLEIMGNEALTETDVYELLRACRYPNLEDVCIWILLDTDYECKDDAFNVAREMYERIVPNTAGILTVLISLALIWIALLLYLTVTSGTTYAEDGSVKHSLNAFDKIWTEVFVAIAAGFGYGAYRAILYMRTIALSIYEKRMTLGGDFIESLLYNYGLYALCGFSISLLFCLVWYSVVRRLKTFNVYRDSLLRILINGIYNLFETVMAHQNSMISVLLPYLIFLLLNFLSIIGIMSFHDTLRRVGLVVFVAILDIAVAARLFRRNAEFNDIIDGINRIRSGEVEYKLTKDGLHGMNKFLADAVNNIGEGIDNAVKTSVKDERLKTDLITNVSHDLKTPLTSIINYVDLLKRSNIQDPQARNYVEILEGKSQRLKDLTDDLVEASKISSGNITLNLEVLNLGELLQQSIGELSEKLEAAKLSVVAEIDETTPLIYADSRRMWRIMENLFNNICKYAMEGTRVYAEVHVIGESVLLQIKNVSRAQMNIHADELTERFIRGDSSRSTEGSGLGLYIAKSLTNVLGGSFEIQLDGDLFKVNIEFPLYHVQEKPDGNEEK